MTEKPFSVMSHLSEWLARKRLGDPKHPTLWPSCAGATDSNGRFHGSCRRMTFLQYMVPLYFFSKATDNKYDKWKPFIDEILKYTTKPDKYQLWLFDNADRYEEYQIEHAKESGIYIGDQVPIYIASHNISGKIDLIVMNPFTGKSIITEIKSVYGYSADDVLGKNFGRYSNFTGEPRTKNLMQVAIYQYHFAKDSNENARLLYGDRGTGKYAEYEVSVDKETSVISYRCIDPLVWKWEKVPYTVLDIYEFYKFILDSVESEIIPQRDYSISYDISTLEKLTDESYKIIETSKEDEDLKEFSSVNDFINNPSTKKSRIFRLSSRGRTTLSESAAHQFIKHLDRKTNGGRQVKKPEEGDYQCRFCQYRTLCYDDDLNPRNLDDLCPSFESKE